MHPRSSTFGPWSDVICYIGICQGASDCEPRTCDRDSLRSVPHQNRVTPLQRARRRLCPWTRLRQSRLPARRERARSGVATATRALDLLPARVPGLAAARAPAAGEVHRALLPRRGDRVRRRPPSVRALPPRGLPGSCHSGASSIRGRARGRRDRRAAARRAGCIRRLRERAQRHFETPFETLPDGAFVVADEDASSCSERSYCGGRRPATTWRRGGQSAERRSSPHRRSWRCCDAAGTGSCRCCTLRRRPGRKPGRQPGRKPGRQAKACHRPPRPFALYDSPTRAKRPGANVSERSISDVRPVFVSTRAWFAFGKSMTVMSLPGSAAIGASRRSESPGGTVRSRPPYSQSDGIFSLRIEGIESSHPAPPSEPARRSPRPSAWRCDRPGPRDPGKGRSRRPSPRGRRRRAGT